MAQGDVLKLNITVDPKDFRPGALEILKHLRPNWPVSSIQFKTFTEGITNILIGVYLQGTFPNDTILIRIYGEKTELIIDRTQEFENIQTLHSVGCAPPLYCAFNNGVCYGFIPGQPIDTTLVRDNHLKRLIAREIARFHAIPPRRASVIDDGGNTLKPALWTKMQTFLDLVPSHFEDPELQQRYLKEVPSKERLQSEMNALRNHLEPLNSPMVFCHNDLLVNNIVYNKELDKVSFIDYEYGFFNYEAFDIGNHFCEYAGVDLPDYSLYPDKDYQLDWLQYYLRSLNEARGRPDDPVTDKDVERLYVQVNKFSLAANFWWGMWALIQARFSNIDFDFLGYSAFRLNEYFAKKEEFFALSYSHL